MSTLHERLLDVAENGHPGDGVDDHEPRLYAAVRAVVELHAPVPRSPLDGGGFSCPVCVEHCSELGEHTCSRGNVKAPCDEIKIIAAQLDVETGETP